jgi:hypothetical protein
VAEVRGGCSSGQRDKVVGYDQKVEQIIANSVEATVITVVESATNWNEEGE